MIESVINVENLKKCKESHVKIFQLIINNLKINSNECSMAKGFFIYFSTHIFHESFSFNFVLLTQCFSYLDISYAKSSLESLLSTDFLKLCRYLHICRCT